ELLHVTDHTDDLRAFSSPALLVDETLAERILARKQLAREGVVDDAYRVLVTVGFGKEASRQQRNAHRLQVSGGRRIEHRLLARTRTLRRAFLGPHRRVGGISQRQPAGDRGGGHARQRGGALAQLARESNERGRGSVARRWQRH